MSVEKETLVYPNLPESNENLNFVLSCIRSDSFSASDDIPTPTWAGCRSLLSTQTSPVMQVGFLPYLSYPVTKHETVYTAMHNFLSVLAQLEQKCLPVFCDEGVFCIVSDIVLKHPKEFENLVPLMGGFHMAKATMHCLGKFLKGCGIEDALVETKAFGLKVIESVLGGSNYVRALRGLLIVAEAVESMKWDAFWMTRDRSDLVFEQSALSDLLLSLKDKDPAAIKSDFQTCIKSTKLKEDRQEFSKQSSESSDMCRYWEGLLQNVNHLKALIATDRDRDWEGHLMAVLGRRGAVVKGVEHLS